MFCGRNILLGQTLFQSRLTFDKSSIIKTHWNENEYWEWSKKFSTLNLLNDVLNIGSLRAQQYVITFDGDYSGPIIQTNASIFHLLPNTYAQSLGLFCKNELKLDKLTPMQFRFRLGSLEYTNWMEQKPNAVNLHW
jgi:hypothetical protein